MWDISTWEAGFDMFSHRYPFLSLVMLSGFIEGIFDTILGYPTEIRFKCIEVRESSFHVRTQDGDGIEASIQTGDHVCFGMFIIIMKQFFRRMCPILEIIKEM